MKTAAFADVNKQINYMKTDHVRGKIFKRREGNRLLLIHLRTKFCSGSGFEDSDEEDSVKENTKARRTVSKHDDSDDDIDDISPYDSISNAGHLKVSYHFRCQKVI